MLYVYCIILYIIYYNCIYKLCKKKKITNYLNIYDINHNNYGVVQDGRLQTIIEIVKNFTEKKLS